MILTDKRFLEILEHCLLIYKKQSERGATFMCNIIKHEGYYNDLFTAQEARLATAVILQRISPFYTLYNYLERDRNAPTPIAKAIQFYEDWIMELKDQNDETL